MNFTELEKIKEAGFVGFKSMRELFLDNSIIPDKPGVYMVLNLDPKPPQFLLKGSGGYFKGKDPNVTFEQLTANWVVKTVVVYIGKAGTSTGSSTLRSRLHQYFKFGQGKNIGHWGGRFIWQLASPHELVVCWKATAEDPRTVEQRMIKDFVDQFGVRPFANLMA